ncbi:phospholipid/cholesterol/gamma-HCH transport system substrate-binding protein [Mycobacterium sp. OAS707]|uniref:MCE family protein n=1 Tax=unclassified Mycobacterium TaxID=2642494 RepID=UPI001789AF02|nr:MCE family protein [Mycobacterium sp. OAS707]MBE1551644.1 phospholipid/cholesterol/gamma-HCH transport system substrate-binding protein [Mycobacterium sp. OAS707]
MLKYRGPRLIRAGFVGLVLIALVIAIGLQPERLWSLATQVTYRALFAEAGGLAAGNKVKLSGVDIGTVTEVSLQGLQPLVTFKVDATVRLASDTSAHIRTGSLLGERVLVLESAGRAKLRPFDVIPVSRTSSPYSLTDAVGDLTKNTASTDTATLNQSLNTLAATIDQIAPQLGPTFDGITRLSKTLNSRNETLQQLLSSASDITQVLADRSQQLNQLILNANDLVEVLVARRQAIIDLLANTTTVAQQLSGLIHDNEQKLAPTLDKLNSVTAMLEHSRDNIARMLPALAKFQITLGETVANGFYYNAYVPDLLPGNILQPFLDYAFGFRRGTGNGKPPDNAGPRAEFPFPRNGIPAPPR